MKRRITFLLAICSFVFISHSFTQVRTGIDVLIETNFNGAKALLEGKRIGLITNPTGVSSSLESTIDIFARAKNLTLVALFGPEHGVRGDVTAGGKVETYTDSATNLPVYSLYGKTRTPTSAMLKGIDVLVYDIQDIGARSYTFINTMALAMEAAAENNIEFIVLDRPNPLTGNTVEGNVLDEKFKSFVGQYPIPYVYGMTCGELAKFLNEEGMLDGKKKCKLTVVTMRGWKRLMWWDETGLPWVPTSPHIPNAQTALYYSMTGILGELETVNIGVGYTMPFQLIGAQWIESKKFADALNAKNILGLHFRPLTYKPYYGGQKDTMLGGVQIYITDRNKVNLVNTQLSIIETLHELYPSKNVFALADSNRIAMFDKVMGTDMVRKKINEGIPVRSIIEEWESGIQQFLNARKKYLLYL